MFRGCLLVCFSLSVLVISETRAQEENNASLYLEAYTDEFQNAFFEALKQKSIENYDKAINLFLECKKLDETKNVVDFQLADCYLSNKQFVLAQASALEAINSDPDNYWYLNKLVEVMDKQFSSIKSLENEIPMDHQQLTENLVLILFKQKKYEEAKSILKEMRSSQFKDTYMRKISDSLKQNIGTDISLDEKTIEKSEDPMEIYKRELEILLDENDVISLINTSEAALEEYPNQPFFYYSKGVALNSSGNPKEAIMVLEMGLDLILEDLEMENKFYKELANGYSLIGNSSKANMYLSKIKSGL